MCGKVLPSCIIALQTGMYSGRTGSPSGLAMSLSRQAAPRCQALCGGASASAGSGQL